MTKKNTFKTFLSDIPQNLFSGFVVSLIALPLGLGLALASGAPPISGIIAAIVGGIVVSLIGGSHVTITGPGNGLVVVILAAITTLGDGNMQEGSFRCDINVSVKRKGTDKLGTRREIKNLNSFKFIEQAIHYETQWQIEMLEEGKVIQQATVLFNPETGETKAMRSKEEANDYRYFPDPDLLPLEISDEKISQIKDKFLII